MPLQISKSRLQRIVRLRRRRAGGGEKVPFKNGTLLACAYVAAAALLALAAAFVARRYIPVRTDLEAQLYLGVEATVLAAAFICGRLLLGLLAPEAVSRNSRLLMLLLASAISNALAAGLAGGSAHYAPEHLTGPLANGGFIPFLVPYLFLPVFCTLLAGPGAGIAMGVAGAVQNLLFVPESAGLQTALVGLATAIAAPLFTARVHRRGTLVRLCFAVGALQLLGALSNGVAQLAALETYSVASLRPLLAPFGMSVALTALSVAASVAAVLLLLGFFEHIFGACSDIRLAAFADLGHPLLARLSLEAPGTYHHSIIVATLSADAAERIGADPILARVGGYYHDVGKLTNPAAFTENAAPGGPSVHDGIAPSMSAIILVSHVKDGVGLAMDYALPAPIRQVIEEHHGTTRMAWFYDKALRQAAERAKEAGGEPEPVDETPFRYAGPRPSFAESAVVSLADSVEAASRSLSHPTPAAIEKLVGAVVDGKVADGQLADAPVTMRDIADVKRAFVSSLSTILHARIPYPKAPDKADNP